MNLLKIIGIIKHLLDVSNSSPRLAKVDTVRNSLPGHPTQYATIALFLAYCVMHLKRIRSFRSLNEFLKNNPDVRKACGLKACPSHDTLTRRYKEMAVEVKQAISQVGIFFIEKKYVNPYSLAADTKLFGSTKHDKEATWGKGSKGFVKGYSLSVLCIATKGNFPFPIAAYAHQNATFAPKILKILLRSLPKTTHFVLGDSGYDFELVYKAVEQFNANGHVTRKAVIAPRKGRIMNPDRVRRLNFYFSTRGKKVFSRRLPSVELFFARLVKQLNVVRCLLSGEKLNQVFLLFSCFVYQAIIYCNIVLNNSNILAIKSILNNI